MTSSSRAVASAVHGSTEPSASVASIVTPGSVFENASRIVSVALEKVQVAALAQRLTELLDELDRRGVEGADADQPVDTLVPVLDEPINEAFRVGTLSMGWDTQDELVLVEARELLAVEEDEEAPEVEEEFDDEDEDGPDFLRVRLTALAARAFVVQALRLISAGRPPCPLCGQPLDPQGHLCPRRNGTAPLLN